MAADLPSAPPRSAGRCCRIVTAAGRTSSGRFALPRRAGTYGRCETVKTHLKHLYGKLGVAGRKDAVARARELGVSPRMGVDRA